MTSTAEHHAHGTPGGKRQIRHIDLRKFDEEEIKLMRPKKSLENAFKDMVIEDASFLDTLDGRSTCSKCGKSRKYFCYTCCIPLPEFAERIPKLKLPFKVDIIKHPKEIDGKSTAVHAAIIASDDVTIYTYPNLPDYMQEDNVLLIFPDKNAVKIEDLWQKLEQNCTHTAKEPPPKKIKPKLPFTKAVFIDCTWNQTRRIYNDERIRGLQCVELTHRETLFWRYQRGKPQTYLATIEAIYYFLVDVHTNVLRDHYQNQYDNLLFFFKFMFEKIHSLYDPEALRAYKDI